MGKKGCLCGCFAFTILIALVGAAVAAFLLWARAPSIEFNNVLPPQNGTSAFELKPGNNFQFNFRLNFTIKNPNYVGATLKKITATGSLPEVSNTQLGEGEMTNVLIPKISNSDILFPIQVDYDYQKDTNFDTLFYIATKCGLLNETKSQLKIKYTVNVAVKVVAISVDLPPFDNDVNIDCPIPPGTKIPGLEYLALAKGLISNTSNLSDNLKALAGQIPPDMLNQASSGLANPKALENLLSSFKNPPKF